MQLREVALHSRVVATQAPELLLHRMCYTTSAQLHTLHMRSLAENSAGWVFSARLRVVRQARVVDLHPGVRADVCAGGARDSEALPLALQLSCVQNRETILCCARLIARPVRGLLRPLMGHSESRLRITRIRTMLPHHSLKGRCCLQRQLNTVAEPPTAAEPWLAGGCLRALRLRRGIP